MMKKIFDKCKTWMYNNWMAVLNFYILAMSYFVVKDHKEVAFAESVLGVWIIVSMGYFIYDTFIKNKKPLK